MPSGAILCFIIASCMVIQLSLLFAIRRHYFRFQDVSESMVTTSTSDKLKAGGGSVDGSCGIYVADRKFHLTSNGMSYIFQAGDDGDLEHLYYGGKVSPADGFTNLAD